MRKLICSMGISLDGYTAGPDGTFDWGAPDEELFRFATDEVRQLDVHFLGRKLYETMRYWETVDEDPNTGDLEREFAALWGSLTKVVFSRTLTSVAPGHVLATGGLADEVAKWRAEPGEGHMAIGGPTLSTQAEDLGLIDEYALRVFPVLVGGGTPFFSRAEQRSDLELLQTRTFSSGVAHARYRVKR